MSSVDWSQLPAQFYGLIPYFELYGDLQFDTVICQRLETMDDSELVEVNQLFQSVLPIEAELEEWIDSIGITQSQAAALVYFTLHFLAIANDSGLIGGT